MPEVSVAEGEGFEPPVPFRVTVVFKATRLSFTSITIVRWA